MDLKITKSTYNLLLTCAILAMSWVAVVPAFATTPTATMTPTMTPTMTSTITPTPIPNDKTNFLGDRIVFKQKMQGHLQRFKKDGTADTPIPICIPGGTYLRDVGQISNDEALLVPDCNWRQFFSTFPFCQEKEFPQCKWSETDPDPDPKMIPADAQIGIPMTTIQSTATPPDRYGFTYGGLVVPFKFELTGDKEFKGSASLGPYMGYRLGFESSGIELAFPVVFAGISNVSATKTTTTTTAATEKTPASTKESSSTSDLAAFSYGAGLIGILKQTFQFGAVIGFDHAGSGQGYQYNDKPWLAVEIGYQFSQ